MITKSRFPELNDSAIRLINDGTYELYHLSDKSGQAKYRLRTTGSVCYLSESGGEVPEPFNTDIEGVSILFQNHNYADADMELQLQFVTR